jgi:Protein of unknown function (DUF3149)
MVSPQWVINIYTHQYIDGSKNDKGFISRAHARSRLIDPDQTMRQSTVTNVLGVIRIKCARCSTCKLPALPTGSLMKLLTDLFSTDYGLMSIGGIAIMLGIAAFFLRFFKRKMDESDSQARQ